jgi:hypothetical protein
VFENGIEIQCFALNAFGIVECIWEYALVDVYLMACLNDGNRIQCFALNAFGNVRWLML